MKNAGPQVSNFSRHLYLRERFSNCFSARRLCSSGLVVENSAIHEPAGLFEEGWDKIEDSIETGNVIGDPTVETEFVSRGDGNKTSVDLLSERSPTWKKSNLDGDG